MVRNSLLWKLTIWFVLLSLLPIGVIVLFVRQDVSDELTDLVKNDIGSQISLLAHQAATSNDDRHLQDLVQGVSGGTHLASVVGQDGRYVAHGEASRVGERVSDDYSAEVVQRIVSGTTGVIVDEDSGRIVGFATLPMESRKVVLTVDKSVVSAPMLRIERSALVQLAVSLFVINVAIGVAVWVVFRPIRRLTAAAEEVGAGNLDVHIDPADMEGELEVLTNAFNEMTTKIRGAQEDLEQTVADRTEELRDSEERYRTLFEDSRNAIFISSGDGSVIDVNQAALELFAFSREEAIGSDIGSRFADPEDRDSFRSEIGRVGSIREFEVRLTRKDGTEIDCLLTATRQFDTDGSSLGVMGIIHDISERKQAEEQGMELVVLEERNRMAERSTTRSPRGSPASSCSSRPPSRRWTATTPTLKTTLTVRRGWPGRAFRRRGAPFGTWSPGPWRNAPSTRPFSRPSIAGRRRATRAPRSSVRASVRKTWASYRPRYRPACSAYARSL